MINIMSTSLKRVNFQHWFRMNNCHACDFLINLQSFSKDPDEQLQRQLDKTRKMSNRRQDSSGNMEKEDKGEKKKEQITLNLIDTRDSMSQVLARRSNDV